jgi:glycerol kinase
VPVERPAFQETTSLGAALAAGLAVGMWSREQVFAAGTDGKARFEPSVSSAASDLRFSRWQKAVSRCLDLADLAGEEEAGPAGPRE